MASALPIRPTTGSSSTGGHVRQSSLNSTLSRSTSNASGAPRIPPKSMARRGGSTSSAQSQASASVGPSIKKRPRKMRRLKSQYPADSQERHVEYILVASFDIDKGPTMEHQYPGAISGDENMLAELMLPDQAHVRSEDWTIFFLHKDTSEEEELREDRRVERLRRREERQKARDAAAANGETQALEEIEEDTADEEEEEGGEGPPLIYVLNLVNTKQDNTVKRGAIVKAMAICTRHPFLHIYKPLLLLALEEYFKSPFPETLELLYDAVNAMDLSLMPRLTPFERQILLASDGKDLFIEKFDQMIQQKLTDETANPGEPLGDSPTKQTFDLGRHQTQKQLPRDTHEYETRVMYNSIPIPIKVPTAISPETVGDFSTIKLIQTFAAPHSSSPQPFMLHPHLTTSGAYTHPIIVLLNAILTQKRIIFLGHNRPSGEVAEAVLAACALVSGTILRGFTRHAFPYTDLTKIDDLLNVPGFIAGVTNPAFANHPEWWDLLCDIPTGRMKISHRIDPALPTDGLLFFQQQHPSFAPSSTGALPPSSSNPPGSDPVGDNVFMDSVLKSISARHGELALRSRWRDYILKFVRLAAAFEEAVYGASALFIGAAEADAGAYGVSGHGYVWPDETARARELGAHVWRIEGWRNTRSYYAFIQDIAALFSRRPIRNMDLQHQVDRLRLLKLSHEDSGRIYHAVNQAVNSYDEVCQLLSATPENHGGLFHLSLGLFHPDPTVRKATVELLHKIKEHEAGSHFWAGLGRFAKVAFWRIWRDMEGRGETAEPPGATEQDGVNSMGSGASAGNSWRARAGPVTNGGGIGTARMS